MTKKVLSAIKSPELYVYLAFAVFYFWFSAQIPYCHDDLVWGTSGGLNNFLASNQNGRYLGNIIEIIMTRSTVLKTIIMGSCSFLLPYIMSCIICKMQQLRSELKVVCFLLCNVLLLTIDREIWQQTYSWIAGYANYCISAVFILVWINEIGNVFRKDLAFEKSSILSCILSGIVCLATQLFLETIAIYTVVASAFIIFVYIKRIGKVPSQIIFMSAGALIGLVLTFSSSVYGTLWSTGEAVEGFRELTFITNSGIKGIVSGFLVQTVLLFQRTFGNNLILVIGITVLLTIILIRVKSRHSFLKLMLVIVNVLYVIWFLAYHFCMKVFGFGTLFPNLRSLILIADSGLNLLYFAVVIAEIVYIFKEKRLFMAKLLSLWVSTFAVIAPLIVTTELGARLFFTSDVFMIAVILILSSELIRNTSVKSMRIWMISLLILCAVPVISYIGIYHQISECTKVRESIIDAAIESKAEVIVLPDYPYEDYLWYPNPTEHKIDEFYEFYGIDRNVEIIFQ